METNEQLRLAAVRLQEQVDELRQRPQYALISAALYTYYVACAVLAVAAIGCIIHWAIFDC